MSMWDKDIMFGGLRLDEVFNIGDRFILWAAQVIGEIPTDLGVARKTVLTVSRENSPTMFFNVGTLAAAIAEKVDQAVEGDFPAIVTLSKVGTKYESDALVIQFVAKYELHEGIGAVDLPDIEERYDAEPIPF